MSRQIAVRLPEPLVAYIDDLVRSGRATSRAAVVIRALEQERRREIAERDVAILTGAPTDADLDELAAYGSRVRMDDLD